MTRNYRLFWLVLAFSVAVATPAFADEYLIFTEAGIPAGGSDVWNWCAAQQRTPSLPCAFAHLPACANPEGAFSFRMQMFEPVLSDAWMGFGVFHNIDPGPDGGRDPWCVAASDPFPCCTGAGTGTCGGDDFATPVNLSAFLGGELRFFVKSPFELNIEMQCEVGGTTKGASTNLTGHGWDGSDTWQEVVIPLADFVFPPGGPPFTLADCLSAVLSPFMSTGANLSTTQLNTFQVDNVRWRTANSHAGASSVQVSGRQLLVNGEPFVVNGANYNPISVGEDWRGIYRDRSDRYTIDFPLMAASGINTVRIYSTFLTTAMLDLAAVHGLYVIPTFPVDTLQLTCAEGKDFMRDRFVNDVLQWKDHPAILGWLIGNEVNVNPGSANLCADWYPQLDAMALAAHNAEGGSFHPVGTANADNGLVDMCQPGCSDDTTLPNLDFWGVQIYRGCSFGSAFADYGAKHTPPSNLCSKPLIVTEFGSDSWDSLSGPSGAENQTMQADCLQTLLDEADQALAIRGASGVSAGQVIFEWADEWWKAFPLTPPVAGFCDVADATEWTKHDTCKGWESFGYPDPAINEEWWGITSVDDVDPNARGLRAAHSVVNAAYQLGAVSDLEVVSFNPGTGNLTVSFDPGAGSTDHTLYYGPLSAVSTYGYTGSAGGLGADGSGSATLPAGDVWWLVVGRNAGAEGCYGKNSACVERPASPGASIPQAANRTCSVPPACP